MRLRSVATPIGGGNDHRDHLSSESGQFRRAVHQGQVQPHPVVKDGGVEALNLKDLIDATRSAKPGFVLAPKRPLGLVGRNRPNPGHRRR